MEGLGANEAFAVHRLAIEEGIRSLQEQTGEVERIRDRIVNLVGLTATASAFLVGAALQSDVRGPRFYSPLVVGTTLFIALLIQGWRILRPFKWRSKVSPTIIVEDFIDGLEGSKALVKLYDDAQIENEERLDLLRDAMRWALATSGALFLSWILLIWLVVD